MKKDVKIDDKIIQEGAGWAAISYVGFLWIFTFIFKKNNEFAHYHAKQGLVLFAGEVIAFLFFAIPVIGWLFAYLGLIVFVILSIYGVFSALMGKLCKIPVVTDIAEKMVI